MIYNTCCQVSYGVRLGCMKKLDLLRKKVPCHKLTQLTYDSLFSFIASRCPMYALRMNSCTVPLLLLEFDTFLALFLLELTGLRLAYSERPSSWDVAHLDPNRHSRIPHLQNHRYREKGFLPLLASVPPWSSWTLLWQAQLSSC